MEDFTLEICQNRSGLNSRCILHISIPNFKSKSQEYSRNKNTHTHTMTWTISQVVFFLRGLFLQIWLCFHFFNHTKHSNTLRSCSTFASWCFNFTKQANKIFFRETEISEFSFLIYSCFPPLPIHPTQKYDLSFTFPRTKVNFPWTRDSNLVNWIGLFSEGKIAVLTALILTWTQRLQSVIVLETGGGGAWRNMKNGAHISI